MTKQGERMPFKLRDPNETSLEKAFLGSQIAATAGGIYGNIRGAREHRKQSRAGGRLFGRMLGDNMRRDYGSVRPYGPP